MPTTGAINLLLLLIITRKRTKFADCVINRQSNFNKRVIFLFMCHFCFVSLRDIERNCAIVLFFILRNLKCYCSRLENRIVTRTHDDLLPNSSSKIVFPIHRAIFRQHLPAKDFVVIVAVAAWAR